MNQATTVGDSETEAEKTVTVTAYAEHGAFGSERDMADTLDDSTDYYERRRKKTRTVALEYDDGETEADEYVYNDAVRDALVEAGVAHPDLTVTDETEVSRPYANVPDSYSGTVCKRTTRALPDTLTGGIERRWSRKWQDDQRRTLVKIAAGGIDARRVLLHRSERDGRRKYETDKKHLSMQFTIDLGPADESTIKAWSEEVVAPFVKELNKLDWVHKVRVTDCKETVERDGDCFNAL